MDLFAKRAYQTQKTRNTTLLKLTKLGSDGERAFETALKSNKIIGWIREFKFHNKRLWMFDFCWRCRKVSVEIDGGQYKKNGGRHNTDDDREKINTAISMGWRVLRFSTQQVDKNPGGCIDLLIKTLNLTKKERKEEIK